MKRLWFLLPAVAFIGLLVWAVVEEGNAPVPGEAAPEFSAPVLAKGERIWS